MSNFLVGDDQYRSVYKSLHYDIRSIKTWIFFRTDKNDKVYLKEYKDWLKVQEYCIQRQCKILSVGLRFKGHEICVDVPKNSRGVYIIQSVRGQVGYESKKTVTIGIVDGDLVNKTHWLVPELVEDLKFVDHVDSCHAPAIVYNA